MSASFTNSIRKLSSARRAGRGSVPIRTTIGSSTVGARLASPSSGLTSRSGIRAGATYRHCLAHTIPASHVEDATRVAGRLWPGRPVSIEPLSGGITNQTFKVTAGSEVLVLRIGGRDTHLLGIDRGVEYEASRMAAAVGVGPEVVAWVEPERWLVTRYIDGRPLGIEDLRAPETIDRVARALLRVHSGPPIPGRFDAHRVVED